MTIYNQIYKSMLKLITSGSWKIGKQLPSENFLKQHYKVNRLTIRKALEILANENLIIKKKGSRAKVISRRPVPKVYFSTSLDDPVLKKKRWDLPLYVQLIPSYASIDIDIRKDFRKVKNIYKKLMSLLDKEKFDEGNLIRKIN